MESARKITSKEIAEEVQANLEKARKANQAFGSAASKADKALSVLDLYSDCLLSLASDTYTNELGQSATALGQSLDTAVNTYNKSFDANVGTFGALIGGAVRAAGGIYIRHEQEKYLRDFINAADAKMIPSLTRDIRILMQDDVKPNLSALRSRLDDDFAIAATEAKTLPLPTIHMINEWYDELDKADKLADAATKSAATYRSAHAKLAAAFDKRTDFQRASEEIQTLISELRAAEKIKEDLKSK